MVPRPQPVGGVPVARRNLGGVLVTAVVGGLLALLVTAQGSRPVARHRVIRPIGARHVEPPTNGLRTFTVPLVDPSRPTIAHGTEVSASRALTTLVWAPAGPGRRPLILFAPGFVVGPTPYEPLLEAWARAGYVVAAIEFPLSDQAVAGPNLDESDLQNEPTDIEFVANALLEPGSPIRGLVDPSRIALAGHSDGGEAALDASWQNGAPGNDDVPGAGRNVRSPVGDHAPASEPTDPPYPGRPGCDRPSHPRRTGICRCRPAQVPDRHPRRRSSRAAQRRESMVASSR